MNENVMKMKVSGKTVVKSLAGAIANALIGTDGRAQDKVEISAIGAASANQAIKGIAVARGFVATSGYDLVMRPGFGEGIVEGEERTTIKMYVSLK